MTRLAAGATIVAASMCLAGPASAAGGIGKVISGTASGYAICMAVLYKLIWDVRAAYPNSEVSPVVPCNDKGNNQYR